MSGEAPRLEIATKTQACYFYRVTRTPPQARQVEKAPKARQQSLQARKQQVVREAIWDAGIDLFAQKGFDETTIEDIVEAAGVSRRSFFRYFSSKSDLMSQRNTMTFQTLLTEAIQSCPSTYSLSEVLRYTVLQVARESATPRTRRIMEVAAKHPAAREALSRIAGAHDSIAAAFAPRCGKGHKARITANLLAGLTLFTLGATINAWCENPAQDIESIADQVFATLESLVRDVGKPIKETNGLRTTRR
jgi:AcrR family transcriptional regulator